MSGGQEGSKGARGEWEDARGSEGEWEGSQLCLKKILSWKSIQLLESSWFILSHMKRLYQFVFRFIPYEPPGETFTTWYFDYQWRHEPECKRQCSDVIFHLSYSLNNSRVSFYGQMQRLPVPNSKYTTSASSYIEYSVLILTWVHYWWHVALSLMSVHHLITNQWTKHVGDDPFRVPSVLTFWAAAAWGETQC